MIIDGALLFSNGQDLTVLAAGTATASTNTIDISQGRDLGVSEPLKLFALCPVVPVSATGGATITVALQGSLDNVTFTTIEDSGPVPISALSLSGTGGNYLFRGQLPIFGAMYRYLRLAYTVSAAMTAGTVEAGINLNVSRDPAYPRNYAA
jgi:hypothetical protein